MATATMLVRDYQPALHNRFYEGGDKAFVGDPYSFSGVGFSSDGKWATLVADSYFISATHHHPAVGSSVTFWEANLLGGTSHAYTVANGQQIGSTDLWVGWFDATVDTDLTRYAVLELPLPADYVNRVLFNYGVTHRVGRNVSDSTSIETAGGSTGWTIQFDYDNNDTPSVGGDETFLQSGDSGAPTFTVWNGQLTLVGIHWAITDNIPGTNEGESSIDTLMPEYVDSVNTVLANKSQSLTVVPEPSTVTLVALGLGGLLACRRLRPTQRR